MMLVMVIGFGIVFKFNDAFRIFATNYFGDYLSCLLETGELPGMQEGECAESFQAFDIESGKMRISDTGLGAAGGGGGGGGGGSGPSSTSNPDSSGGPEGEGSSSKEGDPSDGGGGSIGGGSPGGGRFGDGRGFGGRGSGRPATVPTTKADKVGPKGGNTSVGSAGEIIDEVGDGAEDGRNRTVGFSDYDRDREGLGRQKKSVPVNEEDRKRAARRVAANTETKSKAVGESSGFDFSLGNFLRILLIVGIIVVIVVFIGGQALQISKSSEKGE
jgi:hypothetical protein